MTNYVVLCFDQYRYKSCYLFNDKLNYIGDSNYGHFDGGLVKYKSNFLTIGGGHYSRDKVYSNMKTELLKIDENKLFSLSIETDFKFTQGYSIYSFSLVTVESSDINEEYVLLIGGFNSSRVTPSYISRSDISPLRNVFKFNGTWFRFGKLNNPRTGHSLIHWNGAVYVIGGRNDLIDYEKYKTKIEIWNMKDSPEHFKTIENWPELNNWLDPHLFIVPDSFFPDR